MTRGSNRHLLVLPVVWLASGVYLYLRADRGWIPHDEGTLALAAQRILDGELPHRDFDYPYTGGLAFLHALAFEIFGIRLLSMRWMLLIFSMLFVPAVYRIAARAAPPIGAGLVTLTCVALSLPNYFAPLPSWYNLFFATFGTLALLRYVDTDRRRWLFLAGLCGGLSFAVKSIGLYYVAAALLFLVVREQTSATTAADRRRTWAFSAFTTAGLLAFAGALVLLLRHNARTSELLHFGFPGVILSSFLIANEWSIRRGDERQRWRALFRSTLPFAAGLLLPVILLAVPYLLTSSLPALIRGLFVLPQRRFSESSYFLPRPFSLMYAVPLVLLFAVGFSPARGTRGRVLVTVLGLAVVGELFLYGLVPEDAVEPPFTISAGQIVTIAALTILLPLALFAGWRQRWYLVLPAALVLAGIVSFANRDGVYGPVFVTLRPFVPLTTLGACALLGVPSLARRLPATRRQQVLLLVAMAAMVSLVQIPYTFGIYLCYTAPLLLLAALYVVDSQPWGARPVHVCVLCFYFAFAVVWLNRGSTRACGKEYAYVEQDTPMELPRSGLRVPEPQALEYRRLVDEIERRSVEGAHIYAAPDCPEVYFLSARRNPTRTFYDFFDEDYDTDPGRRADRVLHLLEQHDVRLVVFNRHSEFSGFHAEMKQGLMEKYSPVAGNDHFLLLQRNP